ncbi:DUF1622 domain-containing protein [Novosphingobium sp. NPDC080210]|uniref:DUF1622 domain-containing protein n=1 Tax=Novosphingobium sp. NPDC080210 TaxID=3390596 RepID=UPI003D081A17
MLEELAVSTAHSVTRIVELTGIGIIAIGAFATLAVFLARLARGVPSKQAVSEVRSSLGQAILLGLEFLVAADIINTVAVQPTLGSIAVLAGIVAIRTFLSFSLETEIEGRWPWQRGSRQREI